MLKLKGAILVPDFEYIKAHHNKCFMEGLNSILTKENELNTKIVSSYKELKHETYKGLKYPLVFKVASESSSRGVVLVKSYDELKKVVKKHTFKINYNYLKTKIANCIRKITSEELYDIERFCNNKFIIQDFIPNLKGDYKIIVLGKKYYVLHRLNRENDFRASGSNRATSIDEKEVYIALDLAKKYSAIIMSPIKSFDIAVADEKAYIIETQCVYFGPKTVFKAKHYYTFGESKWNIHRGGSDYVDEFIMSYSDFINEIK